MDYVVFCDKCGFPRVVPKEVMISVFAVAHTVICVNCNHYNEVPEQLQYDAMKLRGDLDE